MKVQIENIEELKKLAIERLVNEQQADCENKMFYILMIMIRLLLWIIGM